MQRRDATTHACAALLLWTLALQTAACRAYDEELLRRGSEAADGQVGSFAPDASADVNDGALPTGSADAAPEAGGNATSSRDAAPISDAALPGSNGDAAPVSDAAIADAQLPEGMLDAGPPDAAMSHASACGPGGMDCCPNDPAKTAPGLCGCGVADTDTDGDATPDCDDDCPTDGDKTARGACGCGASEANAAECSALSTALRHRYRFEGSGSTAIDSVSGANGTVVNATLDASGSLALAGGSSGEHVDLPDGIVSALGDATFEAWLTWQGGNAWQRILDFGSNDGAAGSQGLGVTYLFLTPQTAGGGGAMRAAMSLSGYANETVITAAAPLEVGAPHHVALVVADQSEMRLYVDGALQGMAPLTESLSSLDDVNNWLGRSQYQSDPELGASLHELRIYAAALTPAELSFSFAAGPDPVFLEP